MTTLRFITRVGLPNSMSTSPSLSISMNPIVSLIISTQRLGYTLRPMGRQNISKRERKETKRDRINSYFLEDPLSMMMSMILTETYR